MKHYWSWRFSSSVLLCALVALVIATLTMPVMSALIGSPLLNAQGLPAGIGETILITIAMLPFGILIGSVLALPAALVLGVVMVLLTQRNPQVDRPGVWAVAGVAVTIPALFIVGNVEPWVPTRLIMSVWLLVAGLSGSAVFRWYWSKRTM
jgi:hypothetical protein